MDKLVLAQSDSHILGMRNLPVGNYEISHTVQGKLVLDLKLPETIYEHKLPVTLHIVEDHYLFHGNGD